RPRSRPPAPLPELRAAADLSEDVLLRDGQIPLARERPARGLLRVERAAVLLSRRAHPAVDRRPSPANPAPPLIDHATPPETETDLQPTAPPTLDVRSAQ